MVVIIIFLLLYSMSYLLKARPTQTCVWRREKLAQKTDPDFREEPQSCPT